MSACLIFSRKQVMSAGKTDAGGLPEAARAFIVPGDQAWGAR
jgi:hypothetical protein